ncbi:hypothetical protein N8Z81_05160 [Akkermansiaceae bacterium]|nr:hypothetical protein [Akkermansiaceae bacterium]
MIKGLLKGTERARFSNGSFFLEVEAISLRKINQTAADWQEGGSLSLRDGLSGDLPAWKRIHETGPENRDSFDIAQLFGRLRSPIESFGSDGGVIDSNAEGCFEVIECLLILLILEYDLTKNEVKSSGSSRET